MQLQMKRLLAVMDSEGRRLEAVIFEGESVRLLDRHGQWREGTLAKVQSDSIALREEDGRMRYVAFRHIDHIEGGGNGEDIAH